MIHCPICNSDEIYYCQTVEEYHSVENIEKGNIELFELDDSFVIGEIPAKFICLGCDRQFSVEEFTKLHSINC